MKMMGMCHICGKPAMVSCSKCGRIVCKEHCNVNCCLTCEGPR